LFWTDVIIVIIYHRDTGQNTKFKRANNMPRLVWRKSIILRRLNCIVCIESMQDCILSIQKVY